MGLPPQGGFLLRVDASAQKLFSVPFVGPDFRIESRRMNRPPVPFGNLCKPNVFSPIIKNLHNIGCA